MTQAQIEWLYNHIERMTNKYLAIFPLDDKSWEELVREAGQISKDSNNHPVVMELMIEFMGYFEKLDAVYRREKANG